MTQLPLGTARNPLASLGLIAFLAAGCSSSDPKPSEQPAANNVARSSLSHDTNPNISDADYRAVVDATNQFGFELFQKLIPTETGDVVYSTTSAVPALAMTYLGARGTAQTQMAAVL